MNTHKTEKPPDYRLVSKQLATHSSAGSRAVVGKKGGGAYSIPWCSHPIARLTGYYALRANCYTPYLGMSIGELGIVARFACGGESG